MDGILLIFSLNARYKVSVRVVSHKFCLTTAEMKRKKSIFGVLNITDGPGGWQNYLILSLGTHAYFAFITWRASTTKPLSSGEMYYRKATDFVFVPRRAKTENDPVSIRDLHNLTQPDNTDNQAPLRYAGHRVRLLGPGIRFDGTRCGQDVIRSRKRLRQSPAVFRRALRKPRLVMVGEEGVWWDSN